MDPQKLHLARHYLRRAHEKAARENSEDVDYIATAYEEICELMARLDMLTSLCHFQKNVFSSDTDLPLVLIVGAVIGISEHTVLNLKASFSGGEKPERSSDNGSIPHGCGNWFRNRVRIVFKFFHCLFQSTRQQRARLNTKNNRR